MYKKSPRCLIRRIINSFTYKTKSPSRGFLFCIDDFGTMGAVLHLGGIMPDSIVVAARSCAATICPDGKLEVAASWELYSGTLLPMTISAPYDKRLVIARPTVLYQHLLLVEGVDAITFKDEGRLVVVDFRYNATDVVIEAAKAEVLRLVQEAP
jgi:hypothetical protein